MIKFTNGIIKDIMQTQYIRIIDLGPTSLGYVHKINQMVEPIKYRLIQLLTTYYMYTQIIWSPGGFFSLNRRSTAMELLTVWFYW